MKTLSEKFMDDLTSTAGSLHPILERVRKDHTLMVAIRNKYINIYYRGGNILKLKEMELNSGSYEAFFDKNYDKDEHLINSLSLPTLIGSQDAAKKWVDSFQELKLIMDFYFSGKSKSEREFQQLVVRENNFSPIANECEYFIADIECADNEVGARFDMLAVKWLAAERKNGSNCKATLIEMKYGDKALGGAAGLVKHLKDIDVLISNEKRYSDLLVAIENQFNQLDQLGLLDFNRCKKETKVKLNVEDKPEVVFILANHNPRKTELKKIISDPKIDEYVALDKFDLRFFVSSFAGYGLHSHCMLNLKDFRELLNRFDGKSACC